MGSETQDAQGSKKARQLLGESHVEGKHIYHQTPKNEAVCPGRKVSLARSERWRENNDPDLFSFSCAKQATKQDSLLLLVKDWHFNLRKYPLGATGRGKVKRKCGHMAYVQEIWIQQIQMRKI